MYFSIDVETNNTTVLEGGLLTVGCVAINDKLETVDTFYAKLTYNDDVENEDTANWWKQQGGVVYEEAYLGERENNYEAALRFASWVYQQNADKKTNFMVANPSSFDVPWIDMWLYSVKVPTPFSHRSLCLRSMRFGIYGGVFGEKRGIADHNPDIPHHALSDAIAQGKDLVSLIGTTS